MEGGWQESASLLHLRWEHGLYAGGGKLSPVKLLSCLITSDPGRQHRLWGAGVAAQWAVKNNVAKVCDGHWIPTAHSVALRAAVSIAVLLCDSRSPGCWQWYSKRQLCSYRCNWCIFFCAQLWCILLMLPQVPPPTSLWVAMWAVVWHNPLQGRSCCGGVGTQKPLWMQCLPLLELPWGSMSHRRDLLKLCTICSLLSQF